MNVKVMLFKILGVPLKEATIEKEKEANLIDGEIETPLNTKRLDSLMNIDTAFKQTRTISIIALVCSFLFYSVWS